MLLISISLLAGTITVLLAHMIILSLGKLQLQKNLKDKIEGVKAIRNQRLTGNLLFLAEKIGTTLASRYSKRFSKLAERINGQLTILGQPYSSLAPYTVIGIQLLAACTAIIISIVLLDVWNILILAAAAAAGFYIPVALLQQKAKDKHKAIFRQLPDVLDLLSLMIEAGLDFNTALRKVTESEKGTLIDELNLVQQEIRLGKARSEAFTTMSERVAYLPLRTMTNAITLSFKTGGSIAPTLKALSEQFRVERAQLAEKMANEAPLKLLAPLIILIFPTIFIILFGPILLSFLGYSGN
jgi:tight adherence protein C